MIHCPYSPHSRADGFQLLTDNAQDFKFVGGSQGVSDAMSDALGGRVLLNSPVAKIQWSDKGTGTIASLRAAWYAAFYKKASVWAFWNALMMTFES